MSGLALLIPVALLLGMGGLGAFLWSLSTGHFDDLDGAALRILIDDKKETGEGSAFPRQVGELVSPG